LDQVELEKKSKAIFSRVETGLPPMFLAGRVLARTQERKRITQEMWLWRWVACLSFFAFVGVVAFHQYQPKSETLFAFQPYVIHVDLDEADMKLAESAEVELPEGVSFVSKNQVVKSMRSLRLPVSAVKDGRSRLPFVVLSERSGSMPLQVRIYNSDDQLIQTKTLTLNFRRGQNG